MVVRAVGDVREELSLGEGRTNQNFIVDVAGERSFVRIGSDLPFFGVSRAREQAASRAAHSAGLAPEVRFTSPDAMVVDFVDGRALTEEDLHEAGRIGPESKVLVALAKALRTLHASPVPPELEAFLKEVGDVGWGGPHLAKWLSYAEEKGYNRLPLLPGLRDLIAELEAIAGPLGPNTFCHFDLLADNLVLKKDGSILLVDFEYSAPGQPFMDLAVLAMGCSLTAEEERSLLSAYLGKELAESDHYRFKAVRVLAALRETFWGVTAELSQSSALTAEEAIAYADMNFGKFTSLREEFRSLVPSAFF
ncbi:Etnk1 [Symbiodinium sp. KB8]|nr:Etnk1 [Symbiodinium sp. KB8]